MNVKRFVVACLVVFVFVFFYEWMFHGHFMKDLYAGTANMWRPKDDFMSHMSWLVLGQLIQAILFCLIYTRSETAKQGVGFAVGYGFAIGYGLVIALMRSGNDLITFAVQPLPFSLIGSWIAGSIVEGIIAGALLGAIYRAGPAPAPAPGP